jgi:hypothetical protein
MSKSSFRPWSYTSGYPTTGFHKAKRYSSAVNPSHASSSSIETQTSYQWHGGRHKEAHHKRTYRLAALDDERKGQEAFNREFPDVVEKRLQSAA